MNHLKIMLKYIELDLNFLNLVSTIVKADYIIIIQSYILNILIKDYFFLEYSPSLHLSALLSIRHHSIRAELIREV